MGAEARGGVFARRWEVFGHLTRRLARGANVPMIASGLRWTGYAVAAAGILVACFVVFVLLQIIRYDLTPHLATHMSGPIPVLHTKADMPKAVPAAR
jgi:uncharacterized membrane protein YtjA (UPF0391 family)